MDAARWPFVKDRFHEALALPDSERSRFLGELDPETSAEVAKLLRSADAAGLLDLPLDTALLPAGVERPGGSLPDPVVLGGEGPLTNARLGPYRLGAHIGRGGMGDVYRARRADGLFERAVALKIVRSGADTDVVLARFAAERRILGGLEHPGIARLIAAGAETDGPAAGRPWLALELVDGVPLTEATATMSPEARVALLADVAEAVHHAHRRLVVHRDLKPSNVLVSRGEDDVPHAKLLDFGIAKLLDPALDPALTEVYARTPMTRAYAAPEQVRGGAVTTATDVYGLGLLLFEVLAGRRPFLVGDDVRALERAILDDEPPSPSSVTDLAAGGVEARRLRGDLDVICRTALAKAPEARYASAEALAADLRRWLASEPIEARAPSAAYRARRFVRRHRLGVAAAALVLAAVSVGVASTLWQARQVRAEAERSAATSAFLVSLFGDADPSAVQGDTLTALDLLDRGARRIESELAGQPALQADLYLVVGRAYGSLGQSGQASTFAQRALALRRGAAADAAAAVAAQVAWGSAVGEARGDSILADAVAQARRLRDPDPLLDALYHVALNTDSQRLAGSRTAGVLDEAIDLHRRHHGAGDPHLGVLASRLASATLDVGDYARAEELLRDALRVLPAPAFARERLPVLQDLANILTFTHRRAEAVRLGRQALALARQLYGDDHVRTASTHETLAAALAEQEAVDHVREAVRILEATPTTTPGHLATTYVHMFNALTGMARWEEAVPPARRAAELSRRLPPDDSRRATYTGIYALALTGAERHSEAESPWAESLRLHERIHGERSPLTLLHLLRNARGARRADEAATGALSWGGTGRSAAGRRADRLYARADSLALGALPATSHTRAELAYERGRFLLGAGRAEEAAEPLRRAVAARDVLGRAGVDSFVGVTSQADMAEATLGRALLALGRIEAAERHLARAAPALADSLGADAPDAVVAREALRAIRTRR